MSIYGIQNKKVIPDTVTMTVNKPNSRFYRSTNDLISNDLKSTKRKVKTGYIYTKNSIHDNEARKPPLNDTSNIPLKFDMDHLPSTKVIEHYFHELLNSRTFSGQLIKNLEKLPYRKKWQLVCKEHSIEKGKEIENDHSECWTEHKYQHLTIHDLYQLEKSLRQTIFSLKFIHFNGIDKLIELIPNLPRDLEYVFLRCFKTLMNQENVRKIMIKCDLLMEFLCKTVGDQKLHLRIRFLSTEILLLLSYIDKTSWQVVEKNLNPFYEGWIQSIEYTLDTYGINHTTKSPIISHNQSISNYILSSLFLINSIIQVNPSIEDKSCLFKTWKELGIHRIFSKMKKINVDDLPKEIEIYKKIEMDCLTKSNSDNLYGQDVSYSSVIGNIISETRDTPLEGLIHDLLDSFLGIIATRTFSEAIKSFKLLHSIINYVKNTSYDDENDFNEGNPERILKHSINQIMSDLQSDEIAKRAIKEMEDLQANVEELESEIRILKEERKVTKGQLIEELKSTRKKLENKEQVLLETQEKLEKIDEQRRKEKKKMEQLLAHGSKNTQENVSSVFQRLKNESSTLKLSSKQSKFGSHSKSKRYSSLSSVLTQSAKDRESNIVSNKVIISRNDAGNEKYIGIKQKLVNLPTTTDSEFDNCQHATFESLQKKEVLVPPPAPPLPDILASKIAAHKNIQSLEPTNSVSTKSISIYPTSDMNTSICKSQLSKLQSRSEEQLTSSYVPPPAPPFPMSFQGIMCNNSTEQITTTSEVSTPLPPPPPPLPCSSSSTEHSPSSLLKKVKLKQIHWDKIENINDTMWEELDERREKINQLEAMGIFKEIEDLFQMKQRVTKKPILKPQLKEPQIVSFLSRDLAQQFGINLHMFSQYSVEELLHKVLECSSEINKNQSVLEFFNKEDLNNIPASIAKKFEPYKTDYLTGTEPLEDPNVLERADQIFLALFYNLKTYWAARSRCLLLLLTYEKDYYDIMYKLQKIDDATKAVKNSQRLKDLFFIIIEIGNYINNKQAQGIKLSSLSKLAFVKTNKDSNLSFLHVIERIVRTKYSHIYGFVSDLNRITNLGKVTLDHIEFEVQEYHSRIANMELSFIKGNLSDPTKFHPDDKFLIKVKDKVPLLKSKGESLLNQYKLTMRDLEKLMKYFGEDPKDASCRTTFFQNFVEFIVLFKKVAKENVEREEIEKVYEQRREMVSKDVPSVETPNYNKKINNSEAVDLLIQRLRDIYGDKSMPTLHLEQLRNKLSRVVI